MASRRDELDDHYEGDYGEVRRRRRSRHNVDTKTEVKKKAPLLLRVLSWGGAILLCFVGGYIGTSWMMQFLNTRFLLKQPDNRLETSQDAANFVKKQQENSAEKNLDIPQVSLTLYYPNGTALQEYSHKALAGTQEDNIRDAVVKLLSMSGPEMAAKNVMVRHVFRRADTVFLDLSDSFSSALSVMGQKASSLLITGMVRTMRDNFSPIEKVRFLVNSRVTNAGAPVDLTATWQLPR